MRDIDRSQTTVTAVAAAWFSHGSRSDDRGVDSV